MCLVCGWYVFGLQAKAGHAITWETYTMPSERSSTCLSCLESIVDVLAMLSRLTSISARPATARVVEGLQLSPSRMN